MQFYLKVNFVYKMLRRLKRHYRIDKEKNKPNFFKKHFLMIIDAKSNFIDQEVSFDSNVKMNIVLIIYNT